MYFIKNEYVNTLEVKKSKFIAHLVPFEMYQKRLDELKASHPKARHFVTAYRYLNQFNQIVESSSDDGEPKGTSGKPSLAVLAGADMINTAVIVIRYFGGIKLGTGGLVRAYGEAVNEVLKQAELFKYQFQEELDITFSYQDIRKIEYEIDKLNIIVVDKIFQDDVTYKLKASKELLDKFLSSFHSISHIPHRQENTKC
jgi:uncharacterized YigZ family protein